VSGSARGLPLPCILVARGGGGLEAANPTHLPALPAGFAAQIASGKEWKLSLVVGGSCAAVAAGWTWARWQAA
jgi:hypothetical protein